MERMLRRMHACVASHSSICKIVQVKSADPIESRAMERFIENSMHASRWLMAPIYLGLSIAV